MLVLYLLLLAALALVTAYTRNFQRTLVAVGGEIEDGPATLTPRAQWLRTGAIVLGWPAAFALGVVFIAWWKTVALVVGAFALLVPVLGSLTPRSGSTHYLDRIKADLARRISARPRDAARLRQVLARVEQISRAG
jgi:hypothetical protein